MSLWTPTKRKFKTTFFLIALWIVYTTLCSLTTKAYKEYSFKTVAISSYRKDIEEPTKQYIKATQAARQGITAETVRKLEIAGYINLSAQLSIGFLISYFGSCFIHRKDH
ncbi:hypothetical protein GFL09_06020 [Pseudomonas stutzeri]|uniref:hypothetical protein n=1 Tax=Stutzerimonas stutzeri TaxID=316 RepID=UPI00190DC0B1|nr:hypothetical protein [Stutzerimonas stutzeri]MBK3867253.1 hypothetical protein [Stutzerimonas stutzeri]